MGENNLYIYGLMFELPRYQYQISLSGSGERSGMEWILKGYSMYSPLFESFVRRNKECLMYSPYYLRRNSFFNPPFLKTKYNIMGIIIKVYTYFLYFFYKLPHTRKSLLLSIPLNSLVIYLFHFIHLWTPQHSVWWISIKFAREACMEENINLFLLVHKMGILLLYLGDDFEITRLDEFAFAIRKYLM